MVCSTFDFPAFQLSVILHGITFYKSTFTFFFFILSYTSSCQDLKCYQLEVQLTYQLTLPNLHYGLRHILLFCTSNLSYTPLNHFFKEYVPIYFLLLGLTPLASRITGGFGKTTGQRYSLHIWSTLPKFLVRFAPHFTLSALQISLTLLGITFFMNTLTFCSSLFSANL